MERIDSNYVNFRQEGMELELLARNVYYWLQWQIYNSAVLHRQLPFIEYKISHDTCII